ncbi:MAG: proline--tRNA ligase [Ignavibacteria bacterium]|nr:proline--tRNA ligase [Ignavibacteria bacterium]
MRKKILNYDELVREAGFAINSPTKGCIVILEYGYKIWEIIQRRLDQLIKDTGHSNVYFPLFIPESLMNKEKEHVEGFSPECAVVTHGGGVRLQESLIVRPTSETIMYETYRTLITSYRDLPLKYNQWANVVRWEKRPRPFLRTTEFLWQEGHTAHATQEESIEEVLRMLNIYKTFIEEYLAIPVIAGRKSDNEKFAGAVATYTVEALMRDKKALQCGTSHDLGQSFSKVFEIKFQDKENKQQYVWQTSWGVSTRLIGAAIMAHRDDKGVILPPLIAPYQVVVIPINNLVNAEYIVRIEKELKDKGLRYVIDNRDESAGSKFNKWELKGVPIRLEIGDRECERQTISATSRLGKKVNTPINEFFNSIDSLLLNFQNELFVRATEFQKTNTFDIDQFTEFKNLFGQGKSSGFVKAYFCGSKECEDTIKSETFGVTSRCIPLDETNGEGSCICCKKDVNGKKTIFAKAY